MKKTIAYCDLELGRKPIGGTALDDTRQACFTPWEILTLSTIGVSVILMCVFLAKGE